MLVREQHGRILTTALALVCLALLGAGLVHLYLLAIVAGP